MKALILTTGTPDTIKLVNSFTTLGHETQTIRYDVGNPSGSGEVNIAHEADKMRPDIIVYIGAIKAIHHSWVPSTEQLVLANRIAPMVHICSDPADDPWWPSLEEYEAAGAFRLQVGIDGSFDNPIARFGMITLTPVDPGPFPDPPWESRVHDCGFSGGVGFRESTIGPIRSEGLLTHFGDGRHENAYEDLCRFYTKCRTVINDARTGSGRHRHMKGRFIEAGLARAVVLEPPDSPAPRWFEPGIDYLVWNTPQEAVEHIRRAAAAPAEYEAMGRRLRAKMLERHAAPVFWANVLKRMGL